MLWCKICSILFFMKKNLLQNFHIWIIASLKRKKTPNPKSIFKNQKSFFDKIQLKICEAVIIFNHVRSWTIHLTVPSFFLTILHLKYKSCHLLIQFSLFLILMLIYQIDLSHKQKQHKLLHWLTLKSPK